MDRLIVQTSGIQAKILLFCKYQICICFNGHLQQNHGMEATYEDAPEDKHSFPPAVLAPEAVIVSA